MKERSRDWWQGFTTGGAVAWFVGAGLLAFYARATAAIPAVEPWRSQAASEADAIALKIFIVAAIPGLVAFSLLAVRQRQRSH